MWAAQVPFRVEHQRALVELPGDGGGGAGGDHAGESGHRARGRRHRHRVQDKL